MTRPDSLESLTSQTIDILNQRRSIRRYTDQPIDDGTLLLMLNAARRTSTSSNMQTYSFVVVRDAAKKQALADLCGGQRHVAECAAFVAVCADLTRVAQAAEMHESAFTGNLELSMVSIVDAALAGQSLALAAESLGMGIVMIGGMRNHPDEVAEVLGLPDRTFVVFGICIGWPDESADALKPRLPEEAMIHFERYQPASDEGLNAYDAELAQHYRDQGRVSPDAAWTGIVGTRFEKPHRPHLRRILEERGFSFE